MITILLTWLKLLTAAVASSGSGYGEVEGTSFSPDYSNQTGEGFLLGTF